MAGISWIKLKVGMFEGHSFKRIKRFKFSGMSYRDKLTAIWFELLDLSGKCNNGGLLSYPHHDKAMDIESIAIEIDRETEEVDHCINFFINEGMVSLENGIYCISNWYKYQKEDKLEEIRKSNRERQARFRENQRQRLLESNVTNQKCNVIQTLHNVTDDVNVTSNCSLSISNSLSNNKDDIYNINNIDNPKSIKKSPEKKDKNKQRFEELYTIYPNKDKKAAALKEFMKLKLTDELWDKIISAVEIHRKAKKWDETEMRYIPSIYSWIKDKRWEDEIEIKISESLKDPYELDIENMACLNNIKIKPDKMRSIEEIDDFEF